MDIHFLQPQNWRVQQAHTHLHHRGFNSLACFQLGVTFALALSRGLLTLSLKLTSSRTGLPSFEDLALALVSHAGEWLAGVPALGQMNPGSAIYPL